MKNSLIIPIYNEAYRIEKHLLRVMDDLKKFTKHSEVIFVDDGSKDGSQNLIQNILIQEFKELKNIQFLKISHSGKGAALLHGIQNARGEVILFSDADFPFSFASLLRATQQISPGNIFCATRISSGNQPFLRSLLSKTFSNLVDSLTPSLSGVDTQSCLKSFYKSDFQALPQSPFNPGFYFDIQLLLAFKKRGFSIRKTSFPFFNARNQQQDFTAYGLCLLSLLSSKLTHQ